MECCKDIFWQEVKDIMEYYFTLCFGNILELYSKYENLFVRMKLREDENKEIQSKHRRLILIACKLSVHKVMLFQEKYWNKVYKKMSMKEFEKIIEEFKNECNSER